MGGLRRSRRRGIIPRAAVHRPVFVVHIGSQYEAAVLIVLVLTLLFLVACGPELREEVRIACEQEAREQVSLPWLQSRWMADCARRHSVPVLASPAR